MEELYFEDHRHFSAGTTVEYVDFEIVKPGYMLIIENVGVYNSHATQTLDCSHGVLSGDHFQRIHGCINLAAGNTCERSRPIYIKEGDRLRSGFIGSGATTTGEITVQGFWKKLSEA